VLPTRWQAQRLGTSVRIAAALQAAYRLPVKFKLEELRMLLVNIDVSDLEAGIRFYSSALPLRLGRRLGTDMAELLGAEIPIVLIQNRAGTQPFTGAETTRHYDRHWTPVHIDIAVADLSSALVRAEKAGAVLEGAVSEHKWGSMALLSDPFGNGFCLLQFRGRGYDEIANE
jgi:predicted enzyme related to lactoylglutathione lyase